VSYESRVYDLNHDDAVFGPEPCVVLVVTGTHDVSRLVNVLSQGVIEQIGLAAQIRRQVKASKGGRLALALLKRHGGPDFLEKLPASTSKDGTPNEQ
jgi:hypothetical protein